MMPRLYALQQRLAITATESSALLFVVALLALGLGVRHVQGDNVSLAETDYAALHADFNTQHAATDSTGTTGNAAVDEAQSDDAGAERADGARAAGSRAPRRRAKAGPVRMNLNTASESLLQRLPGIGPKIAARIVADRAERGDFRRPSDIVRVKGVGPKTFEKLEPYLFVEEAKAP